VLVPGGLAHPQHVARGLERREVRELVAGVVHDEQDVDDRLRRQTGHRRRTDVFEQPLAAAECRVDPLPLGGEPLRPGGIVVDELDRRALEPPDEHRRQIRLKLDV
jgi:hypothetical protein